MEMQRNAIFLRSSYDKLKINLGKSYEMLRKVSKINLRKS